MVLFNILSFWDVIEKYMSWEEFRLFNNCSLFTVEFNVKKFKHLTLHNHNLHASIFW